MIFNVPMWPHIKLKTKYPNTFIQTFNRVKTIKYKKFFFGYIIYIYIY